MTSVREYSLQRKFYFEWPDLVDKNRWCEVWAKKDDDYTEGTAAR